MRSSPKASEESPYVGRPSRDATESVPMPVVVPAPTVVPCEEPMTFGDVVTDPVAEAVLVIPRLTLEDGEEQQVVVGKSSDSSPMPIVEVPITWEQPPHVLHGVPSCNVVFSFSAGSSSGIRGWHWKHRARECYDEDVRMHCEEAGGKRVILISDDTEVQMGKNSRSELGFSGKLVVNCNGKSGGLCLFWVDSIIVDWLSFSTFHMQICNTSI
ncbi:hypothetical protein ACOSP7_032312 [Xanthoceras sorbifolium]